MINILKQSGKSICYLLVMLLPQVIVSVVITVGVIACLSMSNQAIFGIGRGSCREGVCQ